MSGLTTVTVAPLSTTHLTGPAPKSIITVPAGKLHSDLVDTSVEPLTSTDRTLMT